MDKQFDNGAGIKMRKLGAFPPVMRKYFEQNQSYHATFDRYRKLPMQALIITAELVQRFIPGVENALHLDAMLAAAVMDDGPPQLHNNEEPTHVIPLPIRLLWVSEKGRPLWACSDLIVKGDAIPARQYWHKRDPGDRNEWASKPNVNTSAGRWKEARIPMQTQQLSDEATLSALAIGNRDEVTRLLNEHISHVGKKTSVGLGRVARWSVDVVDYMTEEESTRSILDRRNVPLDYLTETGADLPPDLHAQLKPNRGWTPPYWHSPFFSTVVGPGG